MNLAAAHKDTRLEQIERDLEAEIAFHLDMLEREQTDAGQDAAQARSEAIHRFGNIAAIRNQCKRIALEEHIMLRKLHLALTIVLLLAVAATTFSTIQFYGKAVRERDIAMQSRVEAEAAHQRAETAQAFLTNVRAGGDPQSGRPLHVSALLDRAQVQAEVDFKHRPEVLASVSQRIEEIRTSLPPPRIVGVVYLEGPVARPGTYNLPNEGLAVRRLLAAAGGLNGALEHEISIVREENGHKVTVWSATWSELSADLVSDSPFLEPNDLVVVRLKE